MSIGTIVIGLVLAALGALSATLLRSRLQRKAVDVQYMKTTALRDLKQSFAGMAGSGLGDNFRQYVELQGEASAANPPRTPYSEKEVAYYTADLIQVYETEEPYKDAEGRDQRRTVRKEEAVSHEKSTDQLLLKDRETGETVALELQDGGLQLDLMSGCDRFEPAQNMQTFGFFSAFVPRQLGNRTLGYRMVEKIIPLGQPLYVLGEAYLRSGSIAVGRPSDAKKAFIISTKSESQIAGEARTGSTVALVAGIVLAVGGVALAVLGIF